MPFVSRFRLSTKIILSTLVAVTITLSIFTLYLVVEQRLKDDRRLNEKAEKISQLLVAASVEHVWNYAEKALEESANGFFTDEEITRIRFRDFEGTVLVDLEKNIQGTRDILRSTDILKEGRKIAKLEIRLTNFYSDLQLKHIRNRFIILFFLILSVLTIQIYAVSKIVLRPLTDLMAGIISFKEKNYTHRIPVAGEDELGLLADAFNDMAGEISQHVAHMEQRVRERTAELEAAKDTAEKANQAKSAFLANMSHEIRTPMNAILGFTEILKRMEIDAQKAGFIDNIHTSGRALLDLINDILDLSKIESGKMKLHHSATSISALMGELDILFSQKIKDKGLAFHIACAPDMPPSLVIDKLRLQQMLINLTSNALKFTHDGSIRIAAMCLLSDDPANNRADISFTVSDTGIGIPKDQQEKIFGTFEQIDDPERLAYGGTGLGLAITKRFVELMGGSIRVDSDTDQGAVFTLHIPQVEIASLLPCREKAYAGQTEAVTFHPCRILIADDIDYNREIFCNYVADQRMTIYQAENGREALDLAREKRPHIILLDMKMPVMDGYTAARKLKEDEELKHIPIVAITASALKHDEELISKICDGYLRKPVSKADLFMELMCHIPHDPLPEPVNIDALNRDEGGNAPLSKEALQSLPPELYEELKTHIEKGYFKGIHHTIETIRRHDAALAGALSPLADNYDYERLVAIVT